MTPKERKERLSEMMRELAVERWKKAGKKEIKEHMAMMSRKLAEARERKNGDK